MDIEKDNETQTQTSPPLIVENETFFKKDIEEKSVPFWFENPNILFQKDYMFEFFPVEDMTYYQKLNAITRTVLILTILTFAYGKSFRILVVGIVTLFGIYCLYFFKIQEEKREQEKMEMKLQENFENPALAVLDNYDTNPAIFDDSKATNPLSNVLLTDYGDAANKKPAMPAFTESNSETILENAKQMVAQANPGQPDISDKLFKDLGDQFVFEQSLKPFHSTPSTTIPNDQAAFADFCYGSMVSCKEGNLFACARNLDRHTN